MDALRSIWDRIQEYLNNLSASQKWSLALITTSVLIAIGALVRFQAGTSYVPLNVQLSPAQQDQVIEHLENNGVPHKIKRGRIYVPQNRKDRLIMELAGKELIPSDQQETQWLFQEDFDTKQKRDMKWNLTKERLLTNMISKTDPVESADVRITPGEDNQILKDGEPAKASVRVKLLPGRELKQKDVRAISRVVAGAVSKLKPSDVTIVDNNLNYHRISDEDSPAHLSAQLKEQKIEIENRYKKKIRSLFNWTNRESVAVNVHLTSKRINKTITKQEGDPEAEERTKESQTIRRREAPGVKANAEEEGEGNQQFTVGEGFEDGQDTQQQQASPGQTIEKTSETESRTGRFVERKEKSNIQVQPGDETRVSATVVLPKDDLFKQALNQDPDEVDEDSEDVQNRLQKEIDEYKSAIESLLATDEGVEGSNKTEAKIITASLAKPAIPTTPPFSERALQYLQENMNTILLLVFILIGIYFVYRIVRSTIPQDVQGEIDRLRSELEEEEEEEVFEDITTEAQQRRAQRLRSEIEDVVEEDPPAAAGMIRKWLEEE